jgi:hypothetical protein
MGKRRRHGGSHSRNGADADTRGDRSNGCLDFAEQPMGVGESRLAFRCRVRGGCYRGYTEGSYCIFKLFKPEGRYAQVQSVGMEDVKMQLTVKRLAEQFNDVCRPTKHEQPCEIIVRDAALGEFDDRECLRDECGRRFRAEAGQTFLLEREIRGKFEKFNSNSGWYSGTDPIIDAFSHWSWVKSGERQLVCDCQGHRGDGSLPHRGNSFYYLLTDPAICSASREFGEGDLGRRGIDAFFRNHTCNEWCEKLDIEYERPEYFSTAELPRRQSTTYNTLMRHDDEDDDDSSDSDSYSSL